MISTAVCNNSSFFNGEHVMVSHKFMNNLKVPYINFIFTCFYDPLLNILLFYFNTVEFQRL